MNAITVDGQILELLEQGDATAAQLREQMIAARTCRGGGEGLQRILEAARQLPPGSAVSVPPQWAEALMERGGVRRVSVHAFEGGDPYVLEVVQLVEKGHVPIETVPRRRAASPEERARLAAEGTPYTPSLSATLSRGGAS